MSWHSYRPYVSAADRKRKAEKTAKKLAGKGQSLSPVQLTGRLIAQTFWGKAWCQNLESYGDYSNRLPRGRTYVRNGSVLDLQISSGKITALVQGSSLYKTEITIIALGKKPWTDFTGRCAGKVTNLIDLLQGKLSKDILQEITTAGSGLFPAPKEIKFNCSCPDWADMCKHVAAVLYGVGARLDEKPELFFNLRGVDVAELIASASSAATGPLTAETGVTSLASDDLGEIFGVEIDSGSAIAPAAPPPKKPKPSKPKIEKRIKKLKSKPKPAKANSNKRSK